MERLVMVVASIASIQLVTAQEPSAPGGTAVFSPVTWERLLNAADEPDNWLMYSATFDSQRFSRLDQVHNRNVRELDLKWTYQIPEIDLAESVPLPRATGAAGGAHRRERRGGRGALTGAGRGVEGPLMCAIVSVCSGRSYDVSHHPGGARLCHRCVQDTAVMPNETGYGFTSGPVVADGITVAGLLGCDMYREDTCYIVGIDGRSGQVVWRTSTVARPGERGGDTWGDLSRWQRGLRVRAAAVMRRDAV